MKKFSLCFTIILFLVVISEGQSFRSDFDRYEFISGGQGQDSIIRTTNYNERFSLTLSGGINISMAKTELGYSYSDGPNQMNEYVGFFGSYSFNPIIKTATGLVYRHFSFYTNSLFGT